MNFTVKQINQEADRLTSAMILCSERYRDYLQNIIDGALGRGKYQLVLLPGTQQCCITLGTGTILFDPVNQELVDLSLTLPAIVLQEIGLIGHEIGHDFVTSDNLLAGVTENRELAHQVQNILEDEADERFMRETFPGTIKYGINAANLHLWTKQPALEELATENQDDLQLLMTALFNEAVFGQVKGFLPDRLQVYWREIGELARQSKGLACKDSPGRALIREQILESLKPLISGREMDAEQAQSGTASSEEAGQQDGLADAGEGHGSMLASELSQPGGAVLSSDHETQLRNQMTQASQDISTGLDQVRREVARESLKDQARISRLKRLNNLAKELNFTITAVDIKNIKANLDAMKTAEKRAARVSQDIEQYLIASSGGREDGCLVGRLNFNQLQRQDQKCFFRMQAESHTPDMAILNLIDMSGSMRGSQAGAARDAAMLLNELCRLRGIAYAAYGFNDNPIQLLDFDWSKEDRTVLSAIDSPSSSTSEHKALALAERVIGERQEEVRAVIVVCDGEPDWPEECKKAVEIMRKRDVKVYCIGIGADKNALRAVYGDWFVNVDPENVRYELPKQVVCMFREMYYGS